MVSLDNRNRVEGQRTLIRQLCDDLDFLASPDIEEKMVCSFDCCILNVTPRFIEGLIESYADDSQSIIGEAELKALQKLDEILDDACTDALYGEEKGFSKTEHWLDFVVFINTVNTLLKDAVQRSTMTINDSPL